MMFTFKKQPRATGLASVANPNQDVEIKLKKKVVGWIASPTAFSRDTYRVWFRVVNDGDGSTCPFKNIKLRREFATELEARIFLNDYFDMIQEKLKLYSVD